MMSPIIKNNFSSVLSNFGIGLSISEKTASVSPREEKGNARKTVTEIDHHQIPYIFIYSCEGSCLTRAATAHDVLAL
jgi:hypothetical protein